MIEKLALIPVGVIVCYIAGWILDANLFPCGACVKTGVPGKSVPMVKVGKTD